jgi:xanthine dehydrogenase accessory factor
MRDSLAAAGDLQLTIDRVPAVNVNAITAESAAAAAAPAQTAPARAAGDSRQLLREVVDAAREASDAVVALVLETTGSTYVCAGAMALFDGPRQVGWLSGGCLEPEIARRATEAAASARIGWLEIDTRDDEDLLSGSALGCRGRLRLALLPLRLLPGIDRVFARWLDGGATLHGRIAADGAVAFACAQHRCDAQLQADAWPWSADADQRAIDWPPPPQLLLLGAGPETDLLLPLLGSLGWRTTLAERRERWRDRAALADQHLDATPAAALTQASGFDAALVMHHNFELDREALDALALSDIAFIGLLGPVRRREDLFKLLTQAQRDALQPRLHSPVGLDLGGRGAEAIALSIAAQLQAWRHARTAVA